MAYSSAARMDYLLRRRICRLVAGLVMADDDVDPREESFLERLLADFGIPEEEHEGLSPIVDPLLAAAEVALLPEAVKDQAMHLLLDAACADGRVMQAEREYLATVARVLGIDRKDTDRMIAVRLSFS